MENNFILIFGLCFVFYFYKFQFCLWFNCVIAVVDSNCVISMYCFNALVDLNDNIHGITFSDRINFFVPFSIFIVTTANINCKFQKTMRKIHRFLVLDYKSSHWMSTFYRKYFLNMFTLLLPNRIYENKKNYTVVRSQTHTHTLNTIIATPSISFVYLLCTFIYWVNKFFY